MTARADDDDDFTLVAEPRPSDRERRKSGRSRHRASRRRGWLRLLTQRPARTVMGAIATALLTSIVINALVLQKARHPAPTFMPVQPPKARAAAHAHLVFASHAHVPAAEPSKAPVEANVRDSITAFLKHNSIGKPRVDSESAEAKSKDAIATLINVKTAVVADSAEPSPETVAAAQQALVRLGFVLRADGVLGVATRQAIKLFERDHGMQVDGNLSPRLIKQLSEMSGIAIP